MSLKSSDIQKAGVLFAELPSSCWLQNAHRSMMLFDNRSPLTSTHTSSRHDVVTSVPPSSSCSLEPPSTARLFPGTASKPAFFQRASESPPKNAAARLQLSQPRSQKRAGAEVTLRTAWIKGPILPGFCVNDPPVIGSSRQVPLLEDAAAVV